MTSWNITTKMADGEVGAIQHAKERWSLLISLKCTVECILMSDSQDSRITSDSFQQVKNDLEHIFEHGQRGKQVSKVRLKLIISFSDGDETLFRPHICCIEPLRLLSDGSQVHITVRNNVISVTHLSKINSFSIGNHMISSAIWDKFFKD